MTGDVVYLVAILAIYVLVGRKLAYSSALHAFGLSKRLRRFLFVFDVKVAVISVAAIMWQVVFYVTAVFSCVMLVVVKSQSSILYIYRIVLIEWIFIAVPLFMYSVISESILRRRK